MKKIFNKACLVMAAFAVLFGFSAQAQTIENPEVLVLGKEYSAKAFTRNYYIFVPETDGKLVMLGNEVPTRYTDATFEEAGNYTFAYVGGKKQVQTDVVAGETVYLQLFPMDNCTFVASMEDNTTINLLSCAPEQNTYFDVAVGQLVLMFDTPVDYSSATLTAGDASMSVTASVYNQDMSFDFKEELFGWLRNGILKKDDTFTLTIEGVCSANNSEVKYNGDGVLVLTFLAPAKPAELVSVKIPENFLSYWAPGDEDGYIVLEYDNELLAGGNTVASLGFGNVEAEGENYSEYLTPIIDGKTLTLNLTGKKRIPAEMVASGTNYGMFKIRVNHIKDIDGNYTYIPGQGTFGSYQKNISYEQLSVNLVAEFTPGDGSSLKGVNNVELWLSTDQAVKYEGIMINYKKASGEAACTIYTKEQVGYDNQGADGVIHNIPITEEMQNGTNVKIELYQPQTLDGEEHPVEAMYNYVAPFEPIEITPAPMTDVAELNTFTLLYDEDITLAEGAQAALMSGNGRSQICTATMKAECKVVTITLDAEVTEYAGYILYVPQGVISNAEGKTNDAMYLKYNLTKVYAAGYNFEPEDGAVVTELSKITVINLDGIQTSWNHDAELYYGSSTTSPVAVVFRNTGIEEVIPESITEPITTCYLTLKDPADPSVDIVITAPGKYRLELPQGFFLKGSGYTSEDVQAFTLNYTIEGATDGIIDVLGDDKKGYEVYNLNGVKVLSVENAEGLYELPAGLYIVNGKKVLIRK